LGWISACSGVTQNDVSGLHWHCFVTEQLCPFVLLHLALCEQLHAAACKLSGVEDSCNMHGTDNHAAQQLPSVALLSPCCPYSCDKQVVPSYMSLVRQHSLLQQQLTALLTQLEVVRLDDAAPIPLVEVEKVMRACYAPLLLYRAVSYRYTVYSVASCAGAVRASCIMC
jgi:hypothetical protein